jgi:hypothetical protein
VQSALSGSSPEPMEVTGMKSRVALYGILEYKLGVMAKGRLLISTV